MRIETDDIFVGIAWDASKAEDYVDELDEAERHGGVNFALPIVLLGTEAEDEEEAVAVFQEAHPHLVVSTVFPLTTLIESGAVS